MKFKYWLTSLTNISNAKKKLLHDCSITAEKLFFMPKNELFDILFFTDDDRKIILESRASYDVEKEWILFQHMMEAVVDAIKNGNFPDEELQLLKEGLEKLTQTEAYEDYGAPFALDMWEMFEKRK